MSEQLEAFKVAKDKLMVEYTTKEKELASMRKELIKVGIIILPDTESGIIPTVSRKTGTRKERKLGPAQIKAIKILSGHELTPAEVQTKMKSHSPVYGLLNKLVERGALKKVGDKYTAK